jgi:hypothetical protein
VGAYKTLMYQYAQSVGDFSRDTFNPLKHYTGVRVQQGVPIVDADWNELEDIRKHELELFLKRFIGNGVPDGNHGFRIDVAAGRLILRSTKNKGVSSIEIIPPSFKLTEQSLSNMLKESILDSDLKRGLEAIKDQEIKWEKSFGGLYRST